MLSGAIPENSDVESAARIVAICASAGGLAALSSVLSSLPAQFPIPVLVVQHLDPKSVSHLAGILSRRCKLRISQASGGEVVEGGNVYIAPPNHHLLIDATGRLSLSDTELVHYVRPSADVMLESVAGAYGTSAIAVILTGTGHDGSSGATSIRTAGGFVVAQDRQSSQFFGMPQAAIEAGAVDLVLPLDEIPGYLISRSTTGKPE